MVGCVTFNLVVIVFYCVSAVSKYCGHDPIAHKGLVIQSMAVVNWSLLGLEWSTGPYLVWSGQLVPTWFGAVNWSLHGLEGSTGPYLVWSGQLVPTWFGVGQESRLSCSQVTVVTKHGTKKL